MYENKKSSPYCDTVNYNAKLLSLLLHPCAEDICLVILVFVLQRLHSKTACIEGYCMAGALLASIAPDQSRYWEF